MICQAVPAGAEEAQPRFGYGSIPAGAYVIPAPRTAAKPVVSAKPLKPKTAAKTAAKTAKTGSAKTGESKANSAKTALPKTIVSTKAKTKPTGAAGKSSSKSQVAQSGSKSVRAKPLPPRTFASSGKSRRSSDAAAAPKRPLPPASRVASRAPLTRSVPAQTLAAVPAAASSSGFHFFGIPVVMPFLDAPAAQVPAAQRPGKSRSFVDVMAARHSLTRDSAPAVADPSPVAKSFFRPASVAAPTIAPQPLKAQDFQLSVTPLTTHPEAVSQLDDSSDARTLPANLVLSPTLPPDSPEATLLEEPALPAPETSIAALSAAPVPESSGPALPEKAPLTAEASKTEHDLSEREREFIRTLAEAAGSVTSTDGQLNRDLPTSIPAAATALLHQVPAETVATFRTIASAAKTTVRDVVPDRVRDSVRDSVRDRVPEVPMETGNDLMPATPEKLPEQLPAFNAPASGKIDVQSDRQADYDQANNKVIFTGKVEMNSAAMRLRAERVEVFLKKDGGGMERLEASGNVLMRTQDTPSGPGQMASAGRASYNLNTGEITLSDWPKIQETGKSHISTGPSTKMFMFTDGRLRTDGPNRTILGGN